MTGQGVWKAHINPGSSGNSRGASPVNTCASDEIIFLGSHPSLAANDADHVWGEAGPLPGAHL